MQEKGIRDLSMNDAKEQVLSDAIATAIEFRRTIIIQRRCIVGLLVLCSILAILLIM